MSRKSICSLAFCIAIIAPITAVNGAEESADSALKIYQDAGIDESQSSQIKALGEQSEQLNIARSHQAMDLISQMKALSLQPDLDEKKILLVQTKINDLENAMTIERIKTLVKIRQILTPQQRVKLVNLMKERNSLH